MSQVNTALKNAYPYDSTSFYQCWWEHLAPKFDIRAQYDDFVLCRKKALKGLASLKELRLAGWNNAWAQKLTPERLEALKKITKYTQWDYLRLHWSELHEGEQAFQQLEAMGLKPIQIEDSPEYIADLSQGWEPYWKKLSQKTRTNYRRKLRDCEFLNPHILHFEGEDAVEVFFERFFEHHIPYWEAKIGYSYFQDPLERAFVVEWAKTLQEGGNLLLEAVVMGDEIVNLSLSIVTGDTLYWLLTINTGRYEEYFPGVVSLHLRIKEACARGIKTFNMGNGDYFYKIQAATDKKAITHLLVANPASLAGQAYVAMLAKHLRGLRPQAEASKQPFRLEALKLQLKSLIPTLPTFEDLRQYPLHLATRMGFLGSLQAFLLDINPFLPALEEIPIW